MRLQLAYPNLNLPKPIAYTDKILLIGSCFTEHMSERLSAHKFQVCSNPHGILFNPLSVTESLNSYVKQKTYEKQDLFLLQELWGSWDHHTRFSSTKVEESLEKINEECQSAAHFLQSADWVMITLGSAFQYFLKENNRPVANNHRAPANWFEKKLLTIEMITDALLDCISNIRHINPKVQFLFTISPVRHIRDGVVDNNRSKARLLESVHSVCEQIEYAHYFPAYELLIDVLRDYRFYDIDMVHPNYLATQIVWEQFTATCLQPEALPIMEQVLDIVTAKNHRTRFPETQAHAQFLAAYKEKVTKLKLAYPFLNLKEEMEYFETIKTN